MSKTFCSLPWVHLSSFPDGKVPLCCNSNHTRLQDVARNFESPRDRVLNFNDNTIEEIFNSDFFKQTRLQMLNGEIPPACKGCFVAEEAGIKSKRLESLEEFHLTEDDARKITDDDGTIKIDFEYLEFRLGNTCNLKCVTCNPNSSSLWVKDYDKLQNKLDFVPKYYINGDQFLWHENDNFWSDLSQYSDRVHSVYINGGEPLLGKKHIKFLEKLNPNCKIKYNSNATIVTDDIIEAWSRFKKVEMNISIDDIEERNNYIRYPSKWKEIIDNTVYLDSIDFIDVSITQTVSIYNIFYIKEFRDFFNSIEIPSHFNFLNLPEFLSAGNASEFMKHSVLDKHKNESYITELINFFKMFESVPSVYKKNMLSKFADYNSQLDIIRKTNFKETFKEWSDIIDVSKDEL